MGDVGPEDRGADMGLPYYSVLEADDGRADHLVSEDSNMLSSRFGSVSARSVQMGLSAVIND